MSILWARWDAGAGLLRRIGGNRLPAAANLAVSGNRLLMNSQPIDVFGVRTASAAMNQTNTDELIGALDSYKSHGLNTVTVFYMGSSGGATDPFSADGTTVDAGIQNRMEQIVEACVARQMVCIVGIFYQRVVAAGFGTYNLNSRASVENAVKLVASNMAGYHNVIINIANEQSSSYYSDLNTASGFDCRDTADIILACQWVHAIDPDRIVGSGGYDDTKNDTIAADADVDVLLFDTGDFNATTNVTYSGTDYDAFAVATKAKPVINVETFGGDTKNIAGVDGEYDATWVGHYMQEKDDAATRPGLGVLFHDNRWTQTGSEVRYRLGGQGTAGDPGLLWWAESVRDRSLSDG